MLIHPIILLVMLVNFDHLVKVLSARLPLKNYSFFCDY